MTKSLLVPAGHVLAVLARGYPSGENTKCIFAQGCAHLNALAGFAGNSLDEARKATKDDLK